MKRVLRVESINLQSKNENLLESIFLNYEQLLNSLQTKIQIVCKSEDFDINKHSIKDENVFKFIKEYSESRNIVNKVFYIILEDKKSAINSSINIITRYLKNMNIFCEEILEYSNYEWDKVEDINKNYIKDDKYYYKTMYVNDWPSYCIPGWLEFLYNSDYNIDINCYIKPQDTFKAIKFLRTQLSKYNANIELGLEQTEDQTLYSSEYDGIQLMLEELRSNSGRLFFVSYYITVKGKTKEELDDNYFMVKNLLNSKGIVVYNCLLFQHKAYKSDINNDLISKDYNLPTSTLKCFFPFQSLNICDKNGIYIGTNIQNKSLIFLDIFARQYAVMLIMGIMGSGKSFLTKNMIKNLSDSGVEVTIFDKSGEYSIFNGCDNVIVHSKKTMKEYIQILKRYNENINLTYETIKKPRVLVIDELWAYIDTDNEYAEEFNLYFIEMILEGRKKYLGILFISQLIESLLNNRAGQTIIKTANIKFLLQMNYSESKMVSTEFDLSKQQENFLLTAQHEGLMMVNSNCVQFKVETTEELKNKFNTNPN